MKYFRFEKRSSQSFRSVILSGLFFSLLITSASCGKSSLNKSSANGESGSTAPKLTRFERDLKSMQTANFKYIYVFRRKDGGVFNSEDKAFLRTNAPTETNRFIATDEEKAYIAGSNFMFPEENLTALAERFEIEDLSPPGAEIQNEKKEESNANKTENINTKSSPANEQKGK